LHTCSTRPRTRVRLESCFFGTRPRGLKSRTSDIRTGLIKTVLGRLRVTCRVPELHIFIRFTSTRATVKCRLVVLGLGTHTRVLFLCDSDSPTENSASRVRDSDSNPKVGDSTTSLLGCHILKYVHTGLSRYLAEQKMIQNVDHPNYASARWPAIQQPGGSKSDALLASKMKVFILICSSHVI
jgi:hypothetical protein